MISGNSLKRLFPPKAKQLVKKVIRGKREADDFYRYYFSLSEPKQIVQVGANDGEMCDPLRPYLSTPGNYSAILIEPLPYYAAKLKELYRGRTDITILQVACGNETGRRELYFIPPDVADLMNGRGPMNNWAHGQGSFDKSVIVQCVRRNSFRGPEYVANVRNYIDSIRSTQVLTRKLRDLIPKQATNRNLLLVIDAQGFELDVLKGIDWDDPPRFIVLEDNLDRVRSKQVRSLLRANRYRYLGGSADKVFCENPDRIKF